MSSAAVSDRNFFDNSASTVELLPTSLRPPAIGEEFPQRCAGNPEDEKCEQSMYDKNSFERHLLEPVILKDTSTSRSSHENIWSTSDCGAYEATHQETKLDRSNFTTPAVSGVSSKHSTSHSPESRDNYGGVSCLKWAENLRYLLEDSDGVKLLKEFLDVDVGCSDSLDFWFACSGLKMVDQTNVDRIVGLVKLIYKKYVRCGNFQLKSDVKKRIVERMRKISINQTIFDEAQLEVEGQLCNETYPQFLKSDIYMHYIQSEGDACAKQQGSSNSSGSDTIHTSFGGRLLATVTEGEELMGEDTVNTTLSSSLSLTSSALLATRRLREGVTSIDNRNYG